MATPHKHSTKIKDISKFRIFPPAKFDEKMMEEYTCLHYVFQSFSI